MFFFFRLPLGSDVKNYCFITYYFCCLQITLPLYSWSSWRSRVWCNMNDVLMSFIFFSKFFFLFISPLFSLECTNWTSSSTCRVHNVSNIHVINYYFIFFIFDIHGGNVRNKQWICNFRCCFFYWFCSCWFGLMRLAAASSIVTSIFFFSIIIRFYGRLDFFFSL